MPSKFFSPISIAASLAFFLSSLLFSCQEEVALEDSPFVLEVEEDTVKPVLTKIEYRKVVEPGQRFELWAELEDNVGISEVELTVFPDFTVEEQEEMGDQSEVFEYFTGAYGGSSIFIKHQVEKYRKTIPENVVEGSYKFELKFRDSFGNMGESRGQFEIIKNPLSPVVTISNYTNSQTMEVSKGGDLVLEGMIRSISEEGLKEVQIELTEEQLLGRSINDSEDPDILDNRSWPLNGSSTFNFQDSGTDFIIDLSNAKPGPYDLIITAIDMEGNVTKVVRDVMVWD